MKIEKCALLKFAIPVVLAIAAAVFQSIAIRQVVKTEEYLALNRDVLPGETINGTDLRAERVSRNFVPTGAIKANKDHIAIGSTIKWKIGKDQLLLTRDIQAGSDRLDIRRHEQPIKFKLEDEQVLAGNFHIGQMVMLLFSNLKEDLIVGGEKKSAHSDIEIGPLRIISIDSATAAYASSPNARVRQIQFAVPVNFKEFPFLRFARNSRDISLQSIYPRTE